MTIGWMTDKINKEQRRIEAKRNFNKRKKKRKPSKRQIRRAVKLSHMMDNMYFRIF